MTADHDASRGGGPRRIPDGETDEARIAKALAHPLRATILTRLGERVMSPGDLAVETGAPLGVVSYHVRMLRDYDCVELVRTEPRRGALQHFYKATARADLGAQKAELPASLQASLIGQRLAEIVHGVTAQDEGSPFNTTSIERSFVDLDERGRHALDRTTRKYLERVEQIGQDAAARSGDRQRMAVAVVTYDQE